MRPQKATVRDAMIVRRLLLTVGEMAAEVLDDVQQRMIRGANMVIDESTFVALRDVAMTAEYLKHLDETSQDED